MFVHFSVFSFFLSVHVFVFFPISSVFLFLSFLSVRLFFCLLFLFSFIFFLFFLSFLFVNQFFVFCFYFSICLMPHSLNLVFLCFQAKTTSADWRGCTRRPPFTTSRPASPTEAAPSESRGPSPKRGKAIWRTEGRPQTAIHIRSLKHVLLCFIFRCSE